MKKAPLPVLRMLPETLVAVERAAKDDRRSVSSLIEKILVEWLRAEGYLPDGSKSGLRPKTGGPRGDPGASIKVEDLTAANDD